MDRTPVKLYHVHGFHTQSHMDTYFSSKTTFTVDCLKFPMERLHNSFVQGHIGGKLLLDFSPGCIIYQLLSAVDFFEDIVVLKVSDRCITELKKWMVDHTETCDWTHASSIVRELEGKSDKALVKEQKLKKAIKQILKCDFQKKNITDPVILQPADCLITSEFLECISKDLEEYVKNLEKCAALLQPEGHLLLFGMINGTFIVVGNDKMHVLKMTKDELTGSFLKVGLIIDVCEVMRRGSPEGPHLCDYDSVIFVSAHKPK